MPAPQVINVIQEEGEISDEIDYALMTYLLKNRGPGFTACMPQLVELEGAKQAIKMNIDSTFVHSKTREIMGLGIVGMLLVDPEKLNVIYCTPLDELQNNMEKLKAAGYEPQPRPRGKY